MEVKEFNNDKLDINELYYLVQDVYNTSVVADVFCSNFQKIDEICNITSLVQLIHQKIDKAFAMIIDTQPEIEV